MNGTRRLIIILQELIIGFIRHVPTPRQRLRRRQAMGISWLILIGLPITTEGLFGIIKMEILRALAVAAPVVGLVITLLTWRAMPRSGMKALSQLTQG
ncbi:MAG: hypothetical protein A2X46_08185 [Lentisphaerae bacterium GWF2_57_35]|nr:MAG: hypothetical protein A2X46_08185 [Lentisphaerae bacterium GWF2_57_35]